VYQGAPKTEHQAIADAEHKPLAFEQLTRLLLLLELQGRNLHADPFDTLVLPLPQLSDSGLPDSVLLHHVYLPATLLLHERILQLMDPNQLADLPIHRSA
jgi:hypothetical protein